MVKEARCFECKQTGRELKEFLERSAIGPYHCRRHRPTQGDRLDMKILFRLCILLFILSLLLLAGVFLYPISETPFLTQVTILLTPVTLFLLLFNLSYQKRQPW